MMCVAALPNSYIIGCTQAAEGRLSFAILIGSIPWLWLMDRLNPLDRIHWLWHMLWLMVHIMALAYGV